MNMKIYQFTVWSQREGDLFHGKRPGTLGAIARVRGVPNLSSEREVDAANVDGNGFLKDASSRQSK